MPITPNGEENAPDVQLVPAPSGGTPRGWTFIGTGFECWLKWAYKYVFGLSPAKKSPALDLGSAYHMLMEGKSFEETEAAFPGFITEAKRLFEVRKKGPPLPPNTKAIIEKAFSIFDGRMTSKPDRIEKSGNRHLARDFKTAFTHSEHDELVWNVDGGILGECIAADTDTALVDIVTKRENASVGTKIVTAKLTPTKRFVLEQMVDAFWQQAEERTKQLAKVKKPTREDVFKAFMPNLKGCVGKFGPCPYYQRCWGQPPESMLYKHTEPPREWAEFSPVIKWRKALDTAYAKAKGVV